MSDPVRIISANDMHVIMTQCLNAAEKIHIAMCLFDDNHRAQGSLNEAMHAALIGAEQCRQLHQSKKHMLAPPPEEIGEEDA
jgi:hypothetical protein